MQDLNLLALNGRSFFRRVRLSSIRQSFVGERNRTSDLSSRLERSDHLSYTIYLCAICNEKQGFLHRRGIQNP